jgi:penicillin-binding protein 1A
MTAVVWMGRDDGTPMGRITGGGPPAELWRGFMSAALKQVAVQPIPPGPPPPPPAPDIIEDLLAPPPAEPAAQGASSGIELN